VTDDGTVPYRVSKTTAHAPFVSVTCSTCIWFLAQATDKMPTQT